VRQMLLEGVDGLVHESDAVRQKQHALDPVAPHQQIAEGNDRTGLPRTGRHHDQGFPLAVTLERFGDVTNGAVLIVAFYDDAVDRCIGQWLPRRASLYEQFEFWLLVEPLHGAGRMARVIPQPVLVAVRVEDDRTLAEPLFQAVRSSSTRTATSTGCGMTRAI